MKKILIVTNGPLCRNPRVFKEATTLGHAGYDVTVLTLRNHAPSEIFDLKLIEGAPFRRVTVDLIPNFTASRARVFLRRLRHWTARKLARHFGVQSIQSLGPASTLLREARRHPADLTIVHNEIAHWVGTQLLNEGRMVAADFEDWHSEDLLPADRQYRPLTLLRRLEHTLLHCTSFTTTTSHALSNALHARYGGRLPEVLTNSFPLQSGFKRSATAGWPTFFWFSQTLGPGRGLEPFLAAWTRMQQRSQLVLLGESASSFASELLASIPVELHSQVKFLGLVPGNELPGLIAQHDIGLALEPASSGNNDLTISNKILQYLNAGLAVIATGTRGQQEVLAHAPAAGKLISLDDPSVLAKQLDEFIADQVQLKDAQRTARSLAESRYCWENEAPKLVALVSKTLTRDNTPRVIEQATPPIRNTWLS